MLNCTRGVLIRVELNLYFSAASASLLWFFQKTTGGPGVAPFGSPRSCPGRNCVFTKDGIAIGSTGNDGRGRSSTALRSTGAERNCAQGKEQSGAHISRFGAEDEHHRHSEGGSGGGAEWNRKRGQVAGRTPC